MAKRNRSRRPPRAPAREPEREPFGASKHERATVAWCGVLFVLIGVAGLAWLPSVQVIWIVFLFFGVATIPQVVAWWLKEFRRRR